jgi:hypothetical protein
MAVAKKTPAKITILKPEMGKARFTIEGFGDGLIVHRFGEKVRRYLREQGMPKVKAPKKPRDPEGEARDAAYIIDKKDPLRRYGEFEENPKFDKKKHLYGFPANAIKGAITSATIDLEGVHKTTIKRSVFVHGTHGDLVEIKSPSDPIRREDVTRLSGPSRAPDLRYRPWWVIWSMTFEVTFNSEVISYEGIANILLRAGMFIGLGERRPEKEGNTFGQFEVTKMELLS